VKLADARVLFAPAHYFTGANVGGSEFSWPYQIIAQVAPRLRAADIVLGELRNGALGSNVTVHEVLPVARQHLFSAGTALAFMSGYWRRGLAIARRDPPDILHHVLPFSPITFNPLILFRATPLGITARTRIVIGPVQIPHEESPGGDAEDIGPLYRGEFDAPAGAPRGRRRRRLIGALAHRLSDRCLKAADAIVAITDETRSYLQERGIRSRIEVIPAGIDYSGLAVVDRSSRMSPFVLLSAAYLVQRKGIDLLLRAVALARTRCDVRLILAGDGPQRANLIALRDALRLGDAVQFAGFLEKDALRAQYAAADALASMSWSESFGMSLLEAMATGMPCISTANAGARALIADGRTGTLTPLGDVEAFAAAIERLASNRAQARALGAAARAAVESRHDWAKIGAAYAALYESLLEKTTR
jgi:glycosyltransferase involved in cell wall biosynthesis